jgi:hypothetical protein
MIHCNGAGYIIKADQEKAFDRLSHEYMFTVLEKFGFGDVFVKWINIFYSEINSSVKCNGLIKSLTFAMLLEMSLPTIQQV